MEESAGPGGENVKVVVRVRPLNTAETREGFRVITKVNTIDGTIRVEMPKKVSHPDDTPAKIFTFDTVFAPEVTNQSNHQSSFLHKSHFIKFFNHFAVTGETGGRV